MCIGTQTKQVCAVCAAIFNCRNGDLLTSAKLMTHYWNIQTKDRRLAEDSCFEFYVCLNTDGKGNWVSDGCVIKSRNEDIIICECNHLSMFGVLVVSMYVVKHEGIICRYGFHN